MQEISKFWRNWLVAVNAFTIIFGLSMVLIPNLFAQIFSLLVYNSKDHISHFGLEAASYIKLAHSVMGAEIVGWGVLMMFVILTDFSEGLKKVG